MPSSELIPLAHARTLPGPGARDRISLPAQLVRLAIRAYQLGVSPLLGTNCRFAPSCSCYARDAVERYGALRGGWEAVKRIGRCHPWHPGGWDPVR